MFEGSKFNLKQKYPEVPFSSSAPYKGEERAAIKEACADPRLVVRNTSYVYNRDLMISVPWNITKLIPKFTFVTLPNSKSYTQSSMTKSFK